MKHSEFVFFIALILIVYSLINFLIFSKTRQALGGFGWFKTAVLSILLLWMASYPIGRFVEASSPGQFSKVLIYAGSLYLGIMIYAFLLILFMECLWLAGKWLHVLPSSIIQNPQKSRQVAALILASILFGTVGYGYLNAFFPRVRTISLQIHKPVHALQKIRLVVASDLHLGILMNKSRLQKIVDQINGLNPDIVLFAGDLVDEDAFGNSSAGLADVLRSIRSKHGVYAVTGNHEYYAGLEKAAAFIKNANIILLQDSVVTVADRFCLIGRKDATADRMGDRRQSVKTLADQCDRRLPILLMNHQPFRLEEAEQQGVDLQVSGHTHHGQMFPFQWITKAVYELSWGYLKKGKTHYYVSCGAGTWGPPIRIGSVPEIVEISLKISPEH